MANSTIGNLTDRSPALAGDYIEIERTVTGSQVGGKLLLNFPWEFVSSVAITAVANIDFTGLAAGYDYLFSLRNAVPAAAADMKIRASQATVFDTGSSYMTAGGAANAATSITITNSNTHATASNGGLSAEVLLPNPGSTIEYKSFLTAAEWANGSGNIGGTSAVGGRYSLNTAAIDGVRFFFSGQNFAALGSIYAYRRRLT